MPGGPRDRHRRWALDISAPAARERSTTAGSDCRTDPDDRHMFWTLWSCRWVPITLQVASTVMPANPPSKSPEHIVSKNFLTISLDSDMALAPIVVLKSVRDFNANDS